MNAIVIAPARRGAFLPDPAEICQWQAKRPRALALARTPQGPQPWPKTKDPVMHLRPALFAAAALAVLASPPAQAQKIADQATFDVSVRGITAGTLSFAGIQDGVGYAVQGRLASSGFAAFVKQVRYDGAARGQLRDGSYVPSSYTEKADTGRRQSESVMAYVGGVPQVKEYKPARKPKKSDLDPASQAGTVDPLTAMYATLRDVEAGLECALSLKLFDGRRASAVTLSDRRTEGGRVLCTGEYRRVAGFSDEDMAEKTRFPFTLAYEPTGNGRMRVVEITADTLFGPARMTRR